MLYRIFTLVWLLCANVCFAQKEKPVSHEDKILFGGCWFVPHNSDVNIRFSEYSNFVLHNLDSNGNEQTVQGKYLLDGNNLWLIYNDRPKEKFSFYKTEGADPHFVIRGWPPETNPLHFVHGSCE